MCRPIVMVFAAVAVALGCCLAFLHGGDVAGVPWRSCQGPIEIGAALSCEGESPPACAAVLADAEPGDRVRVENCTKGRMHPTKLEALGLPVDVNTASVQELTSLPGIGPVTAARIVAGRPYTDLADLRRVRGIGPKTLARLRRRVALSGR